MKRSTRRRAESPTIEGATKPWEGKVILIATVILLALVLTARTDPREPR